MATLLDAAALFDKQKSYGLNIDDKHPFANLLLGADSALFTQSDSDEQLLLTFAFNETTALTGFKIDPAPSGSAPKTVKVFLNQANLSFEDVDTIPPTLVVELTDLASIVPLKQVLFNKVNSISLFVESNQAGTDECTALSRVNFYGKPLAGTDVSQLKKAREEGEE